VKVKDIRHGQIELRQLLRTTTQIHKQYQRSIIQPGDILFSIRGTVGRTAVVPNDLGGANITQDTARICPHGVAPSYLLCVFESAPFRRYVEVYTIGQAVRGLNLRELRLAPVPLPSPIEQVRIGETMGATSDSITAESARLQALQDLRAGLADDLLTGRVRTVPG
jgi:type I restriction enzyme S subunit